MADGTPSPPLLNRGPEALQALLNGIPGEAEAQVRLLTRSELWLLAGACDHLAGIVGRVIRTTWPGESRG